MLETSSTQLVFSLVDHYSLPRVKHFYKNNGMRAQAPRSDEVYIATQGTKIVAALRLHPVNHVFLLRSMCVDSQLRNQGIGSILLDHLQPRLDEIECYCFPFSHLTGFYQRAGFHIISTDLAPEAINDKFQRYLGNGKDICLMKHNHQSMLK